MSMQPYSDEELNYFKFASIVGKEFPDALRSIFVDMWDTRVAQSSTVWDDSPLVRNILHNSEAPNTKIPTKNSFKEWDCTALIHATLYARTFALPDSTGKKKTLGEMYLKGRKPVPGPFHSAVRSSSGDANETIALAIDQLRLLRNTFCHTASPQINKVTFDDYVKHAKDAFTALNFISTTSLERIGNMKESDFPTKKVEKLSEEIINSLRRDFSQFFISEVKHEMSELKNEVSGLKYEISGVKHELNSIKGVLKQTKETTVPDAAMVEDSSKFGLPNETSSEASTSGPQSTGDSYVKGSMPASYLLRLGECVKSVGMIALKNKDDGEPIYTGTAWLVAKEESESYIMTNWHVISTIQKRRRQTQRETKVVIQFDYMIKAQSSNVEFEVAQQPVIFNKNMDYAVLKVQSNCPGIECLNVCTRCPNPDSGVIIVGHPKAELKRCLFGMVLHTPSSSEKVRKWVEDKTKQYCPHEHCEGKEKKYVCVHNYEKWTKLKEREDCLLIHNCQSDHGASGSPVVNYNCEVIALHSWGMFLGNKQQQEKPALEFAHSINFIVKEINKENEALARKLNFYGMKT